MSADKPRLWIETLALSQFRSHARTRLRLDGRPLAIVGPNGAGKTNLLEAASLLSPGRGLRRANADELPRAGAAGAATPDPTQPAWRIRAALATPDSPREILLEAGPEGRRRVEIDGKQTPQTALAAMAQMLWLTPAMDRLWIEGPEGRRRFLDRAALSFFPGHAAASSAYERAMRERNRLLREPRPNAEWLGALEARMAEAAMSLIEARAATAVRLNAAQDGAEPSFPVAQIAISSGVEKADQGRPKPGADALCESWARSRRDDAAAGRTLHGPHRADLEAIFTAKGVAARLCSTGEQKALLISLTLANARALAEDGPAPILLLDEVAAHLDGSRRAALFDALCALGAQAWMTGTGSELFDALGARAQILRVRDAPGGSEVIEEG